MWWGLDVGRGRELTQHGVCLEIRGQQAGVVPLLSIVRTLGIELGSLSLAASTFIHGPILLPQPADFLNGGERSVSIMSIRKGARY